MGDVALFPSGMYHYTSMAQAGSVKVAFFYKIKPEESEESQSDIKAEAGPSDAKEEPNAESSEDHDAKRVKKEGGEPSGVKEEEVVKEEQSGS